MIYLIIDIVYVVMTVVIYLMRMHGSQTIRELDNGYVFYEKLPDSVKDVYWKKDTYLVIMLLVNIGIVMNIVFMEAYLDCEAILIVITLILGLAASIIIYTVLYLRLKKKIIKEM